MAYTYSKIATYTVGSGGVATVSFLNIPQNYTDLVIKWTGRANDNGAGDGFAIEFNGSSTSYSGKILQGSGSVVTSASPTGRVMVIAGTNATANTFASGEIYIPNYTSSNYKSYSTESVTENNATEAYTSLGAGLWSNTAPITSVTLTDTGKTIFQYSTFHLYGIKAEV